MWRLRAKKSWCTREDLNLHAARAAASEAAASAVSPRVPVWCWLEDSNLPPLAYEASALPDELSQLLENRQRDAAPLPVWKRPCQGRRGSAPRPDLDVHDVKERSATGAVVIGVRAHGTRTRTHARTFSAHELGLDELWLVLWAICPPASAAEGDPAPVIPVSASSFARTAQTSWGCPNSRARPRAADRSVDPTVRWRR